MSSRSVRQVGKGLSDTPARVLAVQAEILRAMSPNRKVELIEDANRTCRMLAQTGIELRHPGATAEQRERLLFDLVLGAELAAKVYGPLPPVSG
jgi:hypothetical protein